MKKEIDDLTKYKRIYSGELLIFSLIFLVLGFLFIFGIIKVADWKKWVFSILTLGGGIWIIVDFFWTYKSQKRRQKNSLLDKILLLPNAVAAIGFDIVALINLIKDPTWIGFDYANYFQYMIGSVLLYCGVVYIFEGIYHYKFTHPMVYELMKEAEEQKENDNEENNISNE